LSPKTLPVYEVIRSVVPGLDHDRVMYPDIDAVFALVSDGTIADCVE